MLLTFNALKFDEFEHIFPNRHPIPIAYIFTTAISTIKSLAYIVTYSMLYRTVSVIGFNYMGFLSNKPIYTVATYRTNRNLTKVRVNSSMS